ncbi:MAG TPA: hypothetical protein VMV61_13230 [Patescibacteria group bacterium]|nr:hypothetical protein [Patescibacteria group bacterium]
MATAESDNKRRSSRVFARMQVRAAGRDVRGHKFTKQAETIVINAHGALLYLDAEMDMGSLVTLRSPATEEEQESRVVYIGGASERGLRLGLEFVSPAPHFWGIDFPPTDWKAPASPSAPPA